MSGRVYTATIPGAPRSPLNGRVHWRVTARERKTFREGTLAALLAAHGKAPIVALGAVVTVRLTRIGKRRLDDDNLAASLKAIRDGVASNDPLRLGWFMIDDGDRRLAWVYEQATVKERGGEPRVEIGVRVR